MKKLLVLLVILAIGVVSADSCAPNITLLSQDPYPAVPGDYVKLVFQIENIATSECSDITFKLLPDYPLVFDPGESGRRTFSKVNYLQDYNSDILVPYKVRVDTNAVDGSTPIEVNFQNKGDATFSKTFNIDVEDTRTTFEIFVDDYDSSTGALALQVLNTGDSDVEAIALEVPKQEDITVKGANKIIIGDLDSNEYTTADFEAKPKNGKFLVNVEYSDSINVRRTDTVEVSFDSDYFTNRFSQQSSTSIWTYIFWIVVIAAIVYFYLRHRKKKKARMKKG